MRSYKRAAGFCIQTCRTNDWVWHTDRRRVCMMPWCMIERTCCLAVFPDKKTYANTHYWLIWLTYRYGYSAHVWRSRMIANGSYHYVFAFNLVHPLTHMDADFSSLTSSCYVQFIYKRFQTGLAK
jgi:hypothetical protein